MPNLFALLLQVTPKGWTNVPTQQPDGLLETTMMSNGKIYVVLSVVLIIWFGVLFFLYRTERKLARLEKML